MNAILQQVFFLYIFILLGYGFGKGKKGLRDHTSMLSFLLVNLLLPAKVFGAFSANFTVSYFRDNTKLILVSLVMLAVLHVAGKLVGKWLGKDPTEQGVYEYCVTISNYAYMGYMLAEGLYGSQGLTDMILFCIPFSLYTYTAGYVKLTGKAGGWKRLVNPMTCAIAAGMVVGLTGLQLPEMLQRVVNSTSACVGPISMLMTGITLSGFSLRQMLGDGKVYVMTAIRLVALPLLVFAAFSLLDLQQLLPAALLMAAMPTGLNTIIFPANAGRSPELGAKLALISHGISCITLPLWLMLL